MQKFDIKHRLIYLLRGEPVSHAMIELGALEQINADEIAHYKEEKLGELFNYVVKNVPYYSNIKYRCFCFDDLPIMTKQIIRDNLYDLMVTGVDVSWRSTSGTTGSPLVFPKDRYATGYMDAMMYNAYSWHGLLMGDKQARLWGRAIHPRQKIVQWFKDLVLRRRRLSAFDNTADKFHQYFRDLLSFRPAYFYAYANALYQFAIHLEKGKLDGKALGIKVAICTGEVLFGHQRQKIRKVFGCNVVNEYGSTENGIIGFECEYGTMHVMPTVHVEILEPDDTGLGQLLVTELNSRSMPFIRYKIGDKGRLLGMRCRCNRPFEAIEVHEGRIDDYIVCPDGKLVYDAILAYTLKKFALQFKAYQENYNLLRIYLVPINCEDGIVEKKIEKSLRKYLGREMFIDIVRVDDLPYDASGKFRYFISKINKADSQNEKGTRL